MEDRDSKEYEQHSWVVLLVACFLEGEHHFSVSVVFRVSSLADRFAVLWVRDCLSRLYEGFY